MGSFQKFCLRWNNHSSNFVGNLGLLLSSEEYSDVTICCQGEVWHLHQLVLSASSSHFAQLLRLTPPGQTPILILDGPPASDVHALIHFIYHGEVNVDQDSLPSLLRTAASLRIKGLADVTGLTQELNAESFPVEGEVSGAVCETGAGISCSDGNQPYEELSPLNLSCNKSHQTFKEEGEVIEETPVTQIPTVNALTKHVTEKKRNSNDEGVEILFHPSKKVRTLDSPSSLGATTVAIIAPIGRQTNVSDTVYTPVSSTPLTCKNSEPHENVALTTDSFSKETIQSKPLAAPRQAAVEKVRLLPAKGSTTFFNVAGSSSFPLLNMAISPHIAYQQSSTIQTNLEVIRTDRAPTEVTVPISNRDLAPQSGIEHKSCSLKTADQNISLYDQSGRQSVQDMTTSVADYSATELLSTPVEICSNTVSEQPSETLKTDEKIKTQTIPPLPSEIEETNVSVIPEKTFNHKKFSPCTIPNSSPCKKTVHIVREIYPSTTDPYAIKMESGNETVSINPETPVKNFSPEILIQSPNVVKLTPVSVTSYPSNSNSTFSTNSIIYTASSSSPFKPCETTVCSTSPTINGSVHVSPKGNVPPAEEKQPVFVPSNPSPQDSGDSTDVTCSISASNPPTSSLMMDSAAQNTQRVTINMRTFKEEWRRQLLVDYDSRTNMSICMLCFTTFKSYDGPRKNTYVKHAKRFHPALEEYSDEERGVIISMYEKFHKYDIDMQKEINKSFRATNNSGSSLKRVKISETGLPITSLNTNHTIRDAEGGESSEERATDSGSESKNGENYSAPRETSLVDGDAGGRTSEKDAYQDINLSINNNNNSFSVNNNKRKGGFQHGDAPIPS